MTDDPIVNRVHSTTTRTHGRILNSAGTHHFIIDGPSRPNEEIVSMEAFLAGISSCAAHLLQDFAEEDGIPLSSADVDIEATRRREALNRFDHIDLHIDLTGPSESQAKHLVQRFQER